MNNIKFVFVTCILFILLFFRANVLNESFLRRCLFNFRNPSDSVHGQRRGRPCGSHDTDLSENDKVYFLQIRRFRRSGASRRHLHSASERGQREDLRVSLVLVRNTGRDDSCNSVLSDNNNSLAENASSHVAVSLQTHRQEIHPDDRVAK